jgi:hypothetical protein
MTLFKFSVTVQRYGSALRFSGRRRLLLGSGNATLVQILVIQNSRVLPK